MSGFYSFIFLSEFIYCIYPGRRYHRMETLHKIFLVKIGRVIMPRATYVMPTTLYDTKPRRFSIWVAKVQDNTTVVVLCRLNPRPCL